jgi:hypothetical protein
MSEYFLSGA